LLVLSNFEGKNLTPVDLSFGPNVRVSIEQWTPARYIECLIQARVAIDIKGQDFQSRHKPPTKAMDFLTAGLPFAMSARSSSVEHLAEMGFNVASPNDVDIWFSPGYANECHRFGAALRQQISRESVGSRWWQLLQQVAGQ